jgi:hypothetical protein
MVNTISTVVITPVVQIEGPNIVSLRIAAVESESTVYGARRKYAGAINGISNVAWYRDGVELPAAVKAEKAEYYKALKAIGYSNPSNAWKMVKQYAFENAVELGSFGEVAKEGEGEGEGGETREARTLTLRIVEELTKLHKAANKAREANSEEYSAKVSAAHAKMIEALKCMGVDIGI